MATIQTTTNGALKPANGHVKGSVKIEKSSNSSLSYVDRAIQGTTSSAVAISNWTADTSVRLLDQVASPEQRDALIQQLQDFVLANPQLSAFIGINLLLTGVPLLLFIGFSITTFISSLIVGIVLGIIGALLFTGSAVGLSLAVLLPTILFTTTAATSLFLWGLAGYYALRWFNGNAKRTS